jgi:flagellin
MAAIINTNIASLNLQKSLSTSQAQLNKAMERLSSGLRINKASDDAAGLAIATTLDSSIRGMQVAVRNLNDAVSFSQVQESALGSQTELLQRMRELAVQAKNGSLSGDDRDNLNTEFLSLNEEVASLGGKAFNGVDLFDASVDITYQIGAAAGDTVTSEGLAAIELAEAIVTAGIAGDDGANAAAAMTAIDTALGSINENRSALGALQSRLSSIGGSLASSIENSTAAKSRIMDADYAQETSNLTRGQILQQAGTAMLTQANSMPNIVLSLLKG